MALTFDEKIAIAKLKAEGLTPYAIAKRLGRRKYDINNLTFAKGYGILMAKSSMPKFIDTGNSQYLIQIGNKVFITAGTYSAPVLNLIFELDDEEIALTFLERFVKW